MEQTTDACKTEEAAAHSSGTSQSKRPCMNIADCFPEPGQRHQRPMSEEKILQVLSECDRLFESEKAKKKQGAGPINDNSSLKNESQRKTEDHNSSPRRPDKVSQNSSESSRLFSLLDEIDCKVNK